MVIELVVRCGKGIGCCSEFSLLSRLRDAVYGQLWHDEAESSSTGERLREGGVGCGGLGYGGLRLKCQFMERAQNSSVLQRARGAEVDLQKITSLLLSLLFVGRIISHGKCFLKFLSLRRASIFLQTIRTKDNNSGEVGMR